MFCRFCKTRILKEHRFCPACAEPVTARESDPLLGAERRGRPRPHVALEELLRLREAADRLGGSAVVSRPPGGGGATVVREMVVYACARRDLVAFAVPDPRGAPIAYSAVRPFVATLLGVGPGATEGEIDAAADRRGLVGDAVAGLREILLPDGAAGLGGPTRARVAALAARALLASQAARRRILGVAEQIHRFDPLSRRLVSRLAEPPLPPGVFVVGLHTPGFEAHWPATHRIEIAAAESEHGSALDIVAERLRLLDDATIDVLRAAAVLGASTREDLSALCPDVDLDVSLPRLTERGYLVETPDAISFAHWVVADFVLSEMPEARHAELRLRAAERARNLGASAVLAADHAAQCAEGFLPLVLLERGGEEALRRGDHETAARFFTRGLEIARAALAREDYGSFDPEYATLLFSRDLGRTILGEGDRVRARRVLRAGLELARADCAPRRDIHALLAETGEIVIEGPSRATPTAVARIQLVSPPKGVPA